jgi:acetolactate synthase I/II/III large subunit
MPENGNEGASPMSGAEVLIRYLVLEGVGHVFGIPGSANATTLFELGETGRPPNDPAPAYVICRHETGAAYMADGYARVTDGLATVLVTAGPGAMNALTGAVNAHTSRTPMLVLSGEVSQQFFGKAYLQEGVDADLDIDGVYANACRYSAVVSAPENFVQLLTQALREARSLPGGTAHLSLPDNIMKAPAPPGTTIPTATSAYRVRPIASDRDTMAAIVGQLRSATFPLLFLGNGARTALRDSARAAAFAEAIEQLALPVMTSPNGKGVFPENHPLSLRNYGIAQCEWPAYYLKPNTMDPSLPDRFDALLVLGSELGELATLSLSADPSNAVYTKDIVPSGMFAHVESNQGVIGREYVVTHGLVAEAAHAIDQFVEIVRNDPTEASGADQRRTFVASIKSTHRPTRPPATPSAPEGTIKPQELMLAMQKALDATAGPAHVWVDAGNCVGWCMQNLEIAAPKELHSALAMGPMGFAVAAVVGSALGAPDALSVAVVGDGAFLMHGAEVSTAAAHGAGAVWVVLRDDQLNMVAQGMEGLFGATGPWDTLYRLGDADLSKVAAGLGATTYEVRSPQQAAGAFAAAFALARTGTTPQVIVAFVDPNEAPPYHAARPRNPPADKES